MEDDVINFRKGIVKNVSALAEAIGNNCSATIEYNDPNTAADTLRALRAEPSIVSACVYTRKGDVFASYNRPGTAPLPRRPHQQLATGSRGIFYTSFIRSPNGAKPLEPFL